MLYSSQSHAGLEFRAGREGQLSAEDVYALSDTVYHCSEVVTGL